LNGITFDTGGLLALDRKDRAVVITGAREGTRDANHNPGHRIGADNTESSQAGACFQIESTGRHGSGFAGRTWRYGSRAVAGSDGNG
jgi:hypothetical protein